MKQSVYCYTISTYRHAHNPCDARKPWLIIMLERVKVMALGRLRFQDDNDNENDNEISLSFSLRFCTQRDERLIAYISSSTTTITKRNIGRPKEMKTSAHNKCRSRTRCRIEILTSLLNKTVY